MTSQPRDFCATNGFVWTPHENQLSFYHCTLMRFLIKRVANVFGVVISCDIYPALPSAKEGVPKITKGTIDNL